jgi:MATE family multidrug resistance protein
MAMHSKIAPRIAAPGFHGRICRIAIPACLANLTSVVPGLVDNAFIGRTGSAEDLGAMAIATTFCCFVLWAFGFLRLASAGLASQAFGAGDRVEMKAVFWRGCALAVLFGICLAALAQFFGRLGLELFGAPATTTRIAEDYWNVRMLAAPGDLLVYVVMGWLIGLQRARAVLALQIILNAANIALCALFVLEWRWGVPGAALATALSFSATAVLGVAYVHRVQTRQSGRFDLRAIFKREQVWRLMAINRDIFLRTILLMAFLAYLVRLGASLGPATLAGNHILLGFVALIAQLLDGVTQATESLVGAAIGAAKRADLLRVTAATTVWSAGMAAGLALTVDIAGPSVLPLFTSDPAVLDAANSALPWLAWLPLVCAWCFQLDGIYLGATHSTEMRNGMVIAAAGALGVSLWALPAMGNAGLWVSLYSFYALRALPLALWYGRIVTSIPESTAHEIA